MACDVGKVFMLERKKESDFKIQQGLNTHKKTRVAVFPWHEHK